MSDRNGTGPSDARRSRLDDLFADQPHLSPTMKARLMHERMSPTGEMSAADAIAGLTAQLSGQEPADETVTLAEAPGFLSASPADLCAWAARGRISKAIAVRLLRFREGQLRDWRRGLP